MASSSSVPESSMQETPAYEIRGRTMSLEEWDLNVQVENPVDFVSLAHHGCDIKKYYEAQDLLNYFDMLNGPTYMNLVRHFWVRAQEEMSLEPFIVTEIRSSIMGISVFISKEQIAWVIRRASEGRFVSGLDNNKTSPWNDTVNKTMFNSTKNGKYCDLSREHKLLLKI